jgi:hypothetical protein
MNCFGNLWALKGTYKQLSHESLKTCEESPWFAGRGTFAERQYLVGLANAVLQPKHASSYTCRHICTILAGRTCKFEMV